MTVVFAWKTDFYSNKKSENRQGELRFGKHLFPVMKWSMMWRTGRLRAEALQ